MGEQVTVNHFSALGFGTGPSAGTRFMDDIPMAEPGPNASPSDTHTGFHAPDCKIHLETTTPADDALMIDPATEGASESPAQAANAADAADTDNTRPRLPCRTPTELARWHDFMNRRLPESLRMPMPYVTMDGWCSEIISYRTTKDIRKIREFYSQIDYNPDSGGGWEKGPEEAQEKEDEQGWDGDGWQFVNL